MTDLKTIQTRLTDIRKNISDLDLSIQKSQAMLDNVSAMEKAELKTLNSNDQIRRKEFYENEKKKIASQIAQLAARRKSFADNHGEFATGIIDQLDPIVGAGQLNDAFPILMFPLRLETRFRIIDGNHQLWLRVYPDDCNINRKEELLSESEIKDARKFWIEMWKAGGLEAEERGAWRSMVNGHGSGRSAWVINQYKPLNNKPTKTDRSFKILVVISELVLNANEKNAARAYWSAVWRAKNDGQQIEAALNVLHSDVGAAKAKEIVEEYIPENISEQIPAAITDSKILLEELKIPRIEDFTTTQTSWTGAPKAIALPDRFVAIAYNGQNKRNILFNKLVKENLAVGPDPSLPKADNIQKDDDGNLIVNEDLKWMVDFDKAVEAGMGVRINLQGQEINNGFDKLFVVGLRFSSDEQNGKALLEKLLDDHFYSSDGMELIKQGTPTNNTEEEGAGFTWIADPDKSYDCVLKGTEAFAEHDEPPNKFDGQKLAECIGIDADLLKKVPNAGGKDQLEAIAMNTALFPATMGYFMEEMMDPLFTDKDIDSTKMFFANFVSGRGPIPAIRIGRQPYGILPISVYSKLKFYENASVSSDMFGNRRLPFLTRLHETLMKMDKTWDSLLPYVAHIGKAGDQHQVLLDVMGLHPNSVEFHQRYSQSSNQLYNQLVLDLGPFVAALVVAAIAKRGKDILQELGINLGDNTIPILEKYFLSAPNSLTGPLIDDVPLSETSPVRPYSADGKNYIEWLSLSEPEKIRLQDFGGNAAPNSILYLLLRHALMLSQASSGTKMMISNNLVQNKQAFFDPAFLHVEKNGTGRSKFEHLYSANTAITGSNSELLIDHLYKPDTLKNDIEANDLKATIDALKILEKTSTGNLERLLVEHLDCCGYRIDAWKTGLVGYKLMEQRSIGQQTNTASKGVYLGAYGWLLDIRPKTKSLEPVQLTDEFKELFRTDANTVFQTDSGNLGYIHAPSLNQAAAAAILRSGFESNKSSGTANPFAINLSSERVRVANDLLEGVRNGQTLAALLGYQFERGLHDKYSLGQGEADKFIYPIRKKFPLVADNMEDTKSAETDSIETIEANNVVDGLKLKNATYDITLDSPIFGIEGLPKQNSMEVRPIIAELERLKETHDAISDLVISEQVYQVVKGNFERAAGNADAFSKGSYPPAIDIMNTPRTGVTLTHKMAIHFDAAADSSISPSSIAMSPRAKAEPSINKWLASIMPQPAKVLCAVVYNTPVEKNKKVFVSVENLGLQPLDVLYCFNLETEHAMTELDDRIWAHIRYSVSKHPKTDLSINYTEQIDKNDRSKISFFELADMVKSLRRIVIGSKYVSPGEITVADGNKSVASGLDDVLLDTRVKTLMNDLVPVKTGIEALIGNSKSIAGIIDQLKILLAPHISEASKIEAILIKAGSDVKEFLINPGAASKIAIVNAFEQSINLIGNAVIITNLKNDYGNMLDQYNADFSKFDDLVENTAASFMSMALLDNAQTGIGFMYQGISGIYNSVYKKLDAILKRWDDKLIQFNTLIGQFDPFGVPDEQFDLLRKAERIISSQSTFPLPGTVSGYKSIIDNIKKPAFDNLFNNLKTIKSNSKQKLTEFIVDVEAIIKDIGEHDLISFDVDNGRNDLKTEKLTMVLLKEDIFNALNNLSKTISDKINTAGQLIDGAANKTANEDKIAELLNAARKIAGEEALILPQFKFSQGQDNEFENSYSNSDASLNFVKNLEGRTFVVEDWLGGVSRVREKIHHWEHICVLGEAFIPGSSLEVTPLQFPYQNNDRWLAMKFRDESDENDTFEITGDKLLYTAHFSVPFDKTGSQCGIIMDEWTEVIPSKEETTGIAFHYDQPNSEPPQTMLLMVPPQFTGKWKWEYIVESLEETMDMAKKRAIEPSQIETTGYAQFLPTTMMAVTLHWITVATNLAMNNDFHKRFENN